MAMILTKSRLRLTQAKYFGLPANAGNVSSLIQGSGITLTPSPLTGIGTVAIGALTSDWFPGRNVNAWNSVDWINVKTQYGAKGDTVVLPAGAGGGTMGIGSSILNAGTGIFTLNDVGKYVMVSGAGPGGYPLVTTITGFGGAFVVTLGANASVTVNNVQVAYGTNDTAAFQAAAAALPMYGTFYVPGGQYLVDTFCIRRQFTKVIGDGIGTTVLFNIARPSTTGNNFTSSGTSTSGSPIITALTNATFLTVGTWVNVTKGANQFGSTVKSIDSPTQITMDTNCTFTSGAGLATVAATFAILTVVADRSQTTGNGFVEVVGLNFQNVAAPQYPGTGFNFDGSTLTLTTASLKDCYAGGFLAGAQFASCYEPMMNRCITDGGVVGLLHYGNRYALYHNNLFFQPLQQGVQLVYNGSPLDIGNIFAGNIIQQSGREGILVQGQNQCIIKDNIIDGAGKSAAHTYNAIDLQLTTHSIITGNATTDELGNAPTLYGISANITSTDNIIGPNDMKTGINAAGKILNIVGANNTVTEQGVRTEPKQYGATAHPSAGQSIPSITVTAVQFQTNDVNRGAVWNGGANTRMTVPTASSTVVSGAGVWKIVGTVGWPVDPTGQIRQVYIQKNGATILARNLTSPFLGGVLAAGDAVLVGGTATVNTIFAAAAMIPILTRKVTGGTTGDIRIGTITPGTSFVINSLNGLDTSTVSWAILSTNAVTTPTMQVTYIDENAADGDYYECFVYHNAATALTLTGTADFTSFEAMKIG